MNEYTPHRTSAATDKVMIIRRVCRRMAPCGAALPSLRNDVQAPDAVARAESQRHSEHEMSRGICKGCDTWTGCSWMSETCRYERYNVLTMLSLTAPLVVVFALPPKRLLPHAHAHGSRKPTWDSQAENLLGHYQFTE